MKFVVDENVSFGLVGALRKGGEEVLAVAESSRSISDTATFSLAQKDKKSKQRKNRTFLKNFYKGEISKVKSVVALLK